MRAGKALATRSTVISLRRNVFFILEINFLYSVGAASPSRLILSSDMELFDIRSIASKFLKCSYSLELLVEETPVEVSPMDLLPFPIF